MERTPFDFLHDQPVADLVQACPPVLYRDIWPESPDFRKAPDNLFRELRALGVFLNDGGDIPLYPASGGVPNEFVFFREQFVEQVVIRGFKKVWFHRAEFPPKVAKAA